MKGFNPDPNAPTPRQLRLLALASVYQAAGLAYAFASQGAAAINGHQAAFDALLKSALSDETDIRTRLGNIDDLLIGIKYLESRVGKVTVRQALPKSKSPSEIDRYAVALLRIERNVYTKPKLVDLITQQKKILSQRVTFFDQRYRHPSILAGMATTYLETAGTLRTRLTIKGQQATLTDPTNVDCIRSCLFAGIQAAHIWHDLGGRPWQLIFGRRAMLEDIRLLAAMRHKMKHT
ncbi:MAG: high frequency lysogenization protein HflD [Aquirhabdus sp.]